MSAEPPTDTPFVIVLGIAQDGGFPHAGCRRDCCTAAWDDPALWESVACLAIVDPATQQRWFVDCTPDFPRQLQRSFSVEPTSTQHSSHAPSNRDIPQRTTRLLDAIFLTHAHMGHYSGLIYLGREAMQTDRVAVFAMPRMQEFLHCNAPWNQLIQAKNIEIQSLAAGEPIAANERITVTPWLVPHRNEYSETVAFKISGPNRSVLYAPDVDGWTACDPSIETMIASVDVALLDGTFYSEDELPDRDISQISHPTISESIGRFARLDPVEQAKIQFIHLNHSNPARDSQSNAHRRVLQAGYGIAEEGSVIRI